MPGIDLDQLRIANPCSASWSSMTGDGRARFCGDCRKHVYNLAELTRQQAVELLQTHEGEVCMRIHRRADGTVLVGDCPVGWRAMRRRMTRAAALLIGWITAAFAGLGCNVQRDAGDCGSSEDEGPLMGAICPPDETDAPEAPSPDAR